MTHILNAQPNMLHIATDWRAGAWAGMIGGLVFLTLEMALLWAAQTYSPWDPIHRLSALVLGIEALPQAGYWSSFGFKTVVVALIVHFPLCLAWGLGAAWLMHRFDWVGGLIVCTGLALALYLINFHVLTPLLFPWFEASRNWIVLVSHIAFGITLALVYMGIRKPIIPNTYLL